MKNVYIFLLTVILAVYFKGLGAQQLPRPGEIVITEIMLNPEAVSDANGEWIEIWNATDHELLLNGLIIKDLGTNKHTLASSGKLIIPSGQYWVMARESDSISNGGVKVDYLLQNFSLGNNMDQVILVLADDRIIDQVSYSPGWPLVSGASIELHPDCHSTFENDVPQSWYAASSVFGIGDKGSPGQANVIYSSISQAEGGIRMEVFPNPSQGRFMLEAEFPEILSGEIRMVNLIGQDFIYHRFAEKKILREIIEPAFLSPGVWFVEVIAGSYSRMTRLVIDY